MKLSVAQGAKKVLEAVHSHVPKSDRGELMPVTEAELDGYRDTAVGRAFGMQSAVVSGDGRLMRIVLGPFREQVTNPEPGHKTPVEIHAATTELSHEAKSASRNLSDEQRMEAILAEPNPQSRNALLVLELGHQNASRNRGRRR